jgi:RNA polymerase sigma-70 factor, ECF subfamily
MTSQLQMRRSAMLANRVQRREGRIDWLAGPTNQRRLEEPGAIMTLDLDVSESPSATAEQLMIGYQQADPAATSELIELLSPGLYRFFASQMGSRTDAEDMLQDAWLRIHRVRHTYRPGDPLLPWVYAIARRVRVDNFRHRQRLASHEISEKMECGRSAALAVPKGETDELPSFDELVAPLPESQREVLTMLKVNGLSLEEVARATSSTTGAVKQKVHRAYERLRNVLHSSGQLVRKGVAP